MLLKEVVVLDNIKETAEKLYKEEFVLLCLLPTPLECLKINTFFSAPIKVHKSQ